MIPRDILLIFLVLKYIRVSMTIENGTIISEDKHYVVYLVNAQTKVGSGPNYDDWLCGGAIVSEEFIITSAACVRDATYMYAIAGYNTSILSKDLKTDPCASAVKNKIILTCLPKKYSFSYDRAEVWSNIDIALAQVEKPYNFQDHMPKPFCSWAPSKIRVNYKARLQYSGTGVLIFGWGHSKKWRLQTDGTVYNKKALHYTPTTILDKTVCKESYKEINNTNSTILMQTIDTYMFCTDGMGTFNDKGEELEWSDNAGESNEHNDGCNNLPPALRTACVEKQKMLRMGRNQRRYPYWGTRRNGICQNDHGGPVTTFAGTQEVLIGVASMFLLNSDNLCIGPYLHTSTFCNSAFISCVLERYKTSRTRRAGPIDCAELEQLNKEGIKIETRRISWMHHPDGPAENEFEEDLIERPQIPIQSFL